MDLDGTLIRTDVLWESLLWLLRKRPWWWLALPFWFWRGRARFKSRVARRARLDPAALPYHAEFLAFLRGERSRGRRLLLVTAADEAMARPVAEHVGIFSAVLASDGRENLRGRNKGARLAAEFGERGFDYAGNSRVDLPVWARSRQAIVVNARPGLAERAAKRCVVARVFQ